MPVGGAKAPRLPAERAAAAVMEGTAVIRDNTVSIPSPTRSVATLSAGILPKRYGEAVNSAKRFVAVGRGWSAALPSAAFQTLAFAGVRGSSQVR